MDFLVVRHTLKSHRPYFRECFSSIFRWSSKYISGNGVTKCIDWELARPNCLDQHHVPFQQSGVYPCLLPFPETLLCPFPFWVGNQWRLPFACAILSIPKHVGFTHEIEETHSMKRHECLPKTLWKDMKFDEENTWKSSKTRKSLSQPPETQARTASWNSSATTCSNDRNEARSDKTLTCQVIGVLVLPPLRAVWQVPGSRGAGRVSGPWSRSDRVLGHAFGDQWSLLLWRLCPSHGRQKRRRNKKKLRSLPQALSPAQNMAGGKKKNPPQKGDESYAERFDARYDDSPEVRALPPSLLTEWQANREALEGQNQLKVPNRLQNGLSSIQRTGLWFFCGTQNVLLPNGAGLPDPDAVTAWLARNQATKKSRGNTKKRCSNQGAELQLDPFGSVPGPMRHSLAALAGVDRRGGRALLIVN